MTMPMPTPPPGQGRYRWQAQSLYGGAWPDLDLARVLNGLDAGGWEIVWVVPRGEALLVIARTPRPQQEDPP